MHVSFSQKPLLLTIRTIGVVPRITLCANHSIVCKTTPTKLSTTTYAYFILIGVQNMYRKLATYMSYDRIPPISRWGSDSPGTSYYSVQ